MNDKTGKLIVISAPSGTGKTTVVKKLLEKTPNLVASISFTTRTRRENEKEGVDVDPTRRVRSYDNRVGAVGMYAPNPGGFELRSVLPGEEYLADASESTPNAS